MQRKYLHYILAAALIISAAAPLSEPLTVQATAMSQVQQNINDAKGQLKDINDRINSLTDQQDLLEEQIADLNAEILNTMTSIGMKEDEIAGKEAELLVKEEEIAVTQEEYEAARAKEEQQYNDMVKRVRRMYEKDSGTLLDMVLQGDGFAKLLNRVDFVESIYEYDRDQLEAYEETKNQVRALWDQLEQEKTALEQEKVQLEADRTALESQKAELDGMLAQKRRESSNYEAEIEKARQEAAVAKALIQQEQKKLAQLKAQQAAQNGGNTGGSSSGTTTIPSGSAGDGSLGSQIAQYACQFVGNPYVAGGTSLTNGADCSGFTYRVYMDFGYSLPRTSSEQRSAGRGVDYSEAQPGDLICYSGHVGLYIGNGQIVHASTERTGIKISNATYREILAVRRIV